MVYGDLHDMVGFITFLVTLVLYVIVFSPVFVARTLYEFYKQLRAGIENNCLIKV